MNNRYRPAANHTTYIVDTELKEVVMNVPMKNYETKREWRDRQDTIVSWLNEEKISIINI